MERISGIICEFNPLHEGHRYIISEARRRAETVVCIMSGNFVQRGEVAVFDKYERAKCAIEAGADLVLELPFPWCAAPAEFFAAAGVKIAHSAKVTDLVFGSECADVRVIERASKIYDDEAFAKSLDTHYDGACGFAAARYSAALDTHPDVAEVFNCRNDSLASEYIRQSSRHGFALKYHAVRRIAGISASELRAKMASPSERLYDIERTMFCLDKASLCSFDHECGILNRLRSCAEAAHDGRGMLSLASTKKYTDSRLRRAALFSLTGTCEPQLRELPSFTVLLAANAAGRRVLNVADGIEVITKPSDASSAQYEAASYADTLASLCYGACGARDFIKKSPYIC